MARREEITRRRDMEGLFGTMYIAVFRDAEMEVVKVLARLAGCTWYGTMIPEK